MNVYVAGYQAVSLLHGGVSTQLRNTVRHLGGQGIRATLFDPWSPFRKEECDLFHLFAANIGTYHLAREIHALGIPLVVSPVIYSLHSHRFVRTALFGMSLLKKLGQGIWSDYGLTAEICSWASRVLPNTDAEKSLLARGLGVPHNKLTVVPNGVDERFYHADPGPFKKKYGLENFILNVGHTGHTRKNVLTLIKALGQINHPAVIIGRIIKSDYGDACVREAARHKHILLIDGLENSSELLASAYAACGIFVLPSLFETPGIAALEAGLAGAKVVITRYGGTEEYFKDMATYVEPRSIESIRSGILHALNAKKDNRLREHIRTEYLWPRIAERTARVYREVVALRS
jgi:glycosyltransferase involved in cell wall biosynthesis